MEQTFPVETRKGARRRSDVPPGVLARLASGEIETVNLMEWLAADMAALARAVAASFPTSDLRDSLLAASIQMAGTGVTARLSLAGRAIASALPTLDKPEFQKLAGHRSDLVRQWACYAVNDPVLPLSFTQRLGHTRRFAADRNMTVREAAWMALRPHVLSDVKQALFDLEPLTRDADPGIRRLAIESTRPRSVWGAHIELLKREPNWAVGLLENTRADSAKYVQLAVGNWLNDASKTRPDWVADLCRQWSLAQDRRTEFIVKRAMRSIRRSTGSLQH